MVRCPAGAITAAGHDILRCRDYAGAVQRQLVAGRDDAAAYKNVNRYPGCSLCQTRVPCEDRVPPQPIEDPGRDADPPAGA